MNDSVRRRGRRAPAGELRRLRAAFDELYELSPPEQEREARRRFGADTAFLTRLLRFLKGVPPGPSPIDVSRSPRMRADQRWTPPVAAGEILGERWKLVRPLGRGGQGVVWEAADRVSRDTVAVKLIPRLPGADVARVSRESATLRWLRLPGVVQLLGDGEAEDFVWLAMERLDGSPFPGRRRRGDWTRVEPVLIGLLEALGRIHAAGVIHGDVKPRNVLVDARGLVTVLDMGLATALSGREGAIRAAGTLGYMAPECAVGDAPSVRADLYSVGVLVQRAMHDPSLAALPLSARRVVRSMLASEPFARPESAAEAIRRLRPGRRSVRRRRWTERELRTRFSGHDLFHHLREDAAKALWQRTRGDPVRVEEVLHSWMRAGLARVEGGLVVIDRVSLDRLSDLALSQSGDAARRRSPDAVASVELSAALHADKPLQIARAALRAGRALLDAGRSSHALTAIDAGAAAARRLSGASLLDRLLALAVRAALVSGGRPGIERALWIVTRGGPGSRLAAGLADVLRAASAVQTDRRLAWRLSTRATRNRDPVVQRLAWSVRSLLSQALDIRRQEKCLEESARWARTQTSADVRQALRSWRAWLLYRKGRCAEAARLHLENARRARTARDRSQDLVDAASAVLDSGDPAAALRFALTARRLAVALRLPLREARAWNLERSARLRAGELLEPDLEALAAIDALGFVSLRWNARMKESAAAWRAGRTDLAREILAPLPTSVRPEGLALVELPVVCLAVALGQPCDGRRAEALARRVVEQMAPGVAVQCLSLLADGGVPRRLLLRWLRKCGPLPRGREFTRMREIRSVRDSVRALESG